MYWEQQRRYDEYYHRGPMGMIGPRAPFVGGPAPVVRIFFQRHLSHIVWFSLPNMFCVLTFSRIFDKYQFVCVKKSCLCSEIVELVNCFKLFCC